MVYESMVKTFPVVTRRLLLAALAAGIAGACAEELPSPPSSDAALSRYLETRAGETGFSGAVLVTRAGDVLLERAIGDADRELGVPLATDSIFRIGSLTKPLTATGVLSLVEQNRLTLEAPVCAYLTSCPPEWSEVTIESLLNHTSGVPDLFGEMDEAPVRETAAELERAVARTGTPTLAAAPGTRYAYSNFNYMLLGYVIEAVTGQPWEDFLVESQFEPLGMAKTRYDDVWEIVPGRARGYGVEGHEAVNIEYDDHSAYAAGGLRSTLGDLRVWHEAYVAGDLIGPDLRQRATTAFLGNYGYGWQELELFGRRMYNHSGGIDGFVSHLAYYPTEELLIIVLNNREREDAKATACDLAALVFDVDPVPTGDADWLDRPRGERCRETAST